MKFQIFRSEEFDMTSSEQNGEYWVDYWTNNPIFERENPQSQVARTINKVPIDDETWQAHLDAIERILALSSTDDLLDLCAGNGLIAKPFSLKCRSVMAVDISRALLEKIDSEAYPSVRVLVGDAREVELPEEGFSKGIMYGALQYFVDKEVIDIFAKIYRALRPGGVFLVGDIPDIDRLFDFYNKPEWVAAYFDSIREGRPAIGTWFKKEILTHMARYVGFDQAIALSQPPGFINGHYRFDLLLTK